MRPFTDGDREGRMHRLQKSIHVFLPTISGRDQRMVVGSTLRLYIAVAPCSVTDRM
jgi:hypothetical protein